MLNKKMTTALFCLTYTLLANASVAGGNMQVQPIGFVIGADIGQGYLSSHESNKLNDTLTPVLIGTAPYNYKSFKNGYIIWYVHAGYDFSIMERVVAGAEIGYKSLGQSNGYSYLFVPLSNDGVLYTKTSYDYLDKQQAVDFLLTGRIYLLNCQTGLNILGKAGAAYVRSNNTVSFNAIIKNASGITTQADHNSPVIWRIEPEVNLGIGYTFSNNIDAHLLYTYIGGTSGNINAGTAFNQPWEAVFAYNAISAGLSYSFG